VGVFLWARYPCNAARGVPRESRGTGKTREYGGAGEPGKAAVHALELGEDVAPEAEQLSVEVLVRAPPRRHLRGKALSTFLSPETI
jgi:hypothetical protein